MFNGFRGNETTMVGIYVEYLERHALCFCAHAVTAIVDYQIIHTLSLSLSLS